MILKCNLIKQKWCMFKLLCIPTKAKVHTLAKITIPITNHKTRDIYIKTKIVFQLYGSQLLNTYKEFLFIFYALIAHQ